MSGPLVLGTAIAAGAWLWATAPGPGFFDAGELAAAAAEPGVPHPTGFPAWVLLGQAARLLPWGTLAAKLHAIGAIATCGAAALWLSCLPRPAEQARGAGLLWGIAAALWLPAAPLVALHVRQAEVYPLLALHAAALAALWCHSCGLARIAGLAACAGLGAGIHAEAAGLGAVATAAAVFAHARTGHAAAWRAVATALAWAAPAASVVLALPALAARGPALDWGAIDGVAALAAHLTGASIRAAFADAIGASPGAAAAELARQLTDTTRPWLPLAAVGLLARPAWFGAAPSAWRRVRGLALAAMALDAGWAVFVNPMGLRDGQVGVVAAMALTAMALLPLRALAARGGRVAVAAPLLALALAVGAHLRALDQLPQADLRGTAQLADVLVDALPPGALALAASDLSAALCLFRQVAEGARPDALCLPTAFTRAPRMVWRQGVRRDDAALQAAGGALDAARDARSRAAALGMLLRPAAAAGVLRWEPGAAWEDAQVQGTLRAGFPWGHVGTAPPGPLAQRAAAALAADVAAVCAGAGPGCAGLGPHLASQLGVWAALLLRHHLLEEATEALTFALRLDPSQPKLLSNLAVALYMRQRPGPARETAQAALALDPDFAPAHRVAARACAVLDLGAEALAHAEAVVGPGPLDAAAVAFLRGLQREDPHKLGKLLARRWPTLASQPAPQR